MLVRRSRPALTRDQPSGDTPRWSRRSDFLYAQLRFMQISSRLSAVFGKPVAELTADDIVLAVGNHVCEAGDLEWKSVLYGRSDKDKYELAKDVAALANAAGGIIVLGVEELDACADTTKPVELSGAEEARMQQICNSQVFPYIIGLDIRQLELSASPGRGFFLIVVPRSADAPHAVAKTAETFCYPVRDGLTIRYLREAEIGARYRDRYVARSALASALQKVHDEGQARVSRSSPWLAVSLYPALPADNPSGSTSIGSAVGLAHSWQRYTAPPTFSLKDFHGVPGVRRAILTSDRPYGGVTRSPTAQLHFNGAGFAAAPVSPAQDPLLPHEDIQGASPLAQDLLELQAMALVSLLANYAAHAGAGGDCEIQTQLLLADHPLHPPALPSAVAMFAPDFFVGSNSRDTYAHVPQSLIMTTRPVATALTGNLDELAGDMRAVVQSAHALATDILNQFAIADPCVLRADGQLNTEFIIAKYQAEVSGWAVRHLAGDA